MRAVASIVCLLVVFVVLAGCGGPAGPPTPAESTTTTAGTTTPATAGPTHTASATTPTASTTTAPVASPTTRGTATRPAGRAWTVRVTRVVDGDTMDVRFANGTTTRVRLLGVDTPEVYVENTPEEFEGIPETDAGAAWLHRWGEKASEFAHAELDDRRVTISLDPAADRRGSYGRLLVYVRVDGRLFNRQLLARGYARFYDAPLTRATAFERIEARARRNATGLWGYRAS